MMYGEINGVSYYGYGKHDFNMFSRKRRTEEEGIYEELPTGISQQIRAFKHCKINTVVETYLIKTVKIATDFR